MPLSDFVLWVTLWQYTYTSDELYRLDSNCPDLAVPTSVTLVCEANVETAFSHSWVDEQLLCANIAALVVYNYLPRC